MAHLLRALLILALFFAPASSVDAQERSRTTQQILITTFDGPNTRIAYHPPTEHDMLTHADEVEFAKALSLVRAGQLAPGIEQLEALLEKYPASARIVGATSIAYTQAGDPKKALRTLSSGEDRIEDRYREIDEASRPAVPRFAIERSEAYLAMGREKNAIPWMVEACDTHASDAQYLRAQLLEWATDEDLGESVAREAGKRSDEAPERVPLAMLAAEIEVLAGESELAWTRLDRAEAIETEGRRGELMRALGHRLSVRPGAPPQSEARVWWALASRDYHAELRFEGMQLLLRPGNPAQSENTAVRADFLPVDDLIGAWDSLPDATRKVQLGLDLTAYLRERSEWDLARQVGATLLASDLPSGMMARVEFEQGLSALQGGNLGEARRRLEIAQQQAEDREVRAQALYYAAESHFYDGDFDQARALYDDFANAYSRDPKANDALDRVYLLESGSPLGGGVQRAPGLDALAKGLYAEARGDWVTAADFAREADVESNLGDGEGHEVRAQALLLLSRVEERQGNLDPALAAVMAFVQSMPDDRLAPVARKRAGDLQMAQGDLAEALGQYEELLVQHPRSWLAPEVRRLVTELRGKGVQ